MDVSITLPQLWHGLGWPLAKLVVNVSMGLLVGNFIEALNWTRGAALPAAPLIRLGNLSETVGASFSMAFVSPVTSNTMLAEAYDQGRLSRQELILANLLNTLPNYFLHLPTVFFLTAPLIKGLAVADQLHGQTRAEDAGVIWKLVADGADRRGQDIADQQG